MNNIISVRIADFLKNFPPFDVLSKEQLATISENIRVLYLPKNQFLFKANDQIQDDFYVVKDGAIGIFREEDTTLVDECDEGDIFGLRALIRKDNYQLSAKAIEESIVYSISSTLLEEIIQTNTEANKFLIASFATNTRNPYANEDKGTLFANVRSLQIDESSLTEVQSVTYSKNPITCSLDTTIQQAAITMSAERVGSIVITKQKQPIGIITDKDLRLKIATGKFSINNPVQDIMSSPVITYPENISVAEAQIAMLKHKITHVCITKDGTPYSELTGILSEHDIVAVNNNNPSVLIKEVKRAQNIDKLKDIRHRLQKLLRRYVDQHIPILYISKIINAINEAIIQKVISLSIAEMGSTPPVTFCWLALGSQGRREQLLMTDQDNALVFENVPKEQHQNIKTYFLKLSEKITGQLNTIGFDFCPAEMMASNPKWCLSLDEWKNQFHDWITNPDKDRILLSMIFFDYHPVYGNEKLVEEMSNSIFNSIKSYKIFLNFMGLNALQNPPPLSFFRQFLVENSGEHKDQFDIKARAIMPLVDAARLLTLDNHLKGINSTIHRYQKLAVLEPHNKDLYDSCINAFRVLLRFRTQQGLKNNNSGRFIDLKSLSKLDRLKLKGCFKPIKDIQELIKVRFSLSQML